MKPHSPAHTAHFHCFICLPFLNLSLKASVQCTLCTSISKTASKCQVRCQYRNGYNKHRSERENSQQSEKRYQTKNYKRVRYVKYDWIYMNAKTSSTLPLHLNVCRKYKIIA